MYNKGMKKPSRETEFLSAMKTMNEIHIKKVAT